jgi:hypothetical protein
MWNKGKVLFSDDGKLALDPSCCCGCDSGSDESGSDASGSDIDSVSGSDVGSESNSGSEQSSESGSESGSEGSGESTSGSQSASTSDSGSVGSEESGSEESGVTICSCDVWPATLRARIIAATGSGVGVIGSEATLTEAGLGTTSDDMWAGTMAGIAALVFSCGGSANCPPCFLEAVLSSHGPCSWTAKRVCFQSSPPRAVFVVSPIGLGCFGPLGPAPGTTFTIEVVPA